MIKPPIEHGWVAGPDGMAFDVEGNLYVALLIQGDITVLNRDGGVKERREVDRTFPTGVTYGLRDSLELMRALGLSIEQVRASGGGRAAHCGGRFWQMSSTRRSSRSM